MDEHLTPLPIRPIGFEFMNLTKGMTNEFFYVPVNHLIRNVTDLLVDEVRTMWKRGEDVIFGWRSDEKANVHWQGVLVEL